MKIDIYSDTVCPWCRIGKQNLYEALAHWPGREEVTIRWHAFQLDPTTPLEGKPFRENFAEKFGGPERMAEMFGHVCKVGEACGLSFDFDRIGFSPNTLLSHQLIKIVPEDRQTEVVEAVMKAYFEEGKNIGDIDVLMDTVSGLGLDTDSLRARMSAKEGVKEVQEDLAFASRAGISGVPYFIFNDKYALSGAQPAKTFLQAFEQIESAAK